MTSLKMTSVNQDESNNMDTKSEPSQVFLMTMHGDIQAIYEKGSFTIYGFGDGGNTSSSRDPNIVFEEEYSGSWGYCSTVGKYENGKIRVYHTNDRSSTIMGDSSVGSDICEYNDIHEYIQESKMQLDKPMIVLKCEASSLHDCYKIFHEYFDTVLSSL